MWWIGVHVGPGKRFRVLRKLGSGVCSTALHAQDTDRTSAAVLKVFDEDLARDRGLIQRLEREAKRQTTQEIPGIGPFLGHFRRGDSLVVFRDFVEGISFEDWLAEESRRAETSGARRASTERAVELFESIVNVVAAAHEAGLWHLGLCPANLFVETNSRALRIVDFGVAHIVGYSRYAERRGDSPYLAPEQVHETNRIDPRIDVYALGVLLHALLAGNPQPAPLGNRDARPPRGRRAALLELVRRACHVEPRQRPGNAASLRRAFAEVLAAFPAEEDGETSLSGSRPAGFKRTDSTDPTWRRAPGPGPSEAPSPEWLRIETPLAMRPLPSDVPAESAIGARKSAPEPRPGRSRDPLFDTSGSLKPVIGLEETVPRQAALSPAEAAAALAELDDEHRAPTAERPGVSPEDTEPPPFARQEETTSPGSQPVVSGPFATPEPAAAPPSGAEPVPVPTTEATTLLRAERIRAAIAEEVEDTPPPGHTLLVGDTSRSAEATVALRTPAVGQPAAVEARPARVARRPARTRYVALAAVPLILGALVVAWFASRDPDQPGGETAWAERTDTSRAVDAAPATTPVSAAASEAAAEAVLEAEEPTPQPEPDRPVGLLAAADETAEAPSEAAVQAAHATVLESEQGGVHFSGELWNPGNTWVMRVHRRDESTSQPDYYIRRTVLASSPHPWGTHVVLREEGGTAPPRQYDFIASASCLIQSASREILFCMPPRGDERHERPVPDGVASPFRLPASSGEVVFDPDLGWIEERLDGLPEDRVSIELAGYRVGGREGGDVERATPSCHWDERIVEGPGIGRNDEGGPLGPEMLDAASWGVHGRLRRIDVALTGPHGFGRLRTWYSRYTAAFRLEPVVGPAERPATSVELPVAGIWRWAPPNGPEYVALHFAREGMERIDLLTLGPGPQVREQILLPETMTGEGSSMLGLVPGPSGCTLTVRRPGSTEAAPAYAFDLGD